LSDSNSFDASTIEARILAYESFGIHRTGWPGDDRTTEWLLDELRRIPGGAGIEAAAERFSFPRFECRRAYIDAGDGPIEGVPMYDGGVTSAGGFEAELCEEDDADPFGKIVLASSAAQGDRRWTAPEVREHYEVLRAEGILGVVVPTGDRLGEVVVRNAEHIDQPFNLPVLQIPRRDIQRLSVALVSRRNVTFEIDADRLQSRATNVVAMLPSTVPSGEERPPIVVMTPKSGWFTCAAERGGGIAAWLAIAESATALEVRPRAIHFIASSGHELSHQGLRHYLHYHQGLLSEAALWMHLGASIGARFPAARVGASDQPLLDLATRSLDAAGAGPYEAMAAGDPGRGEAREIAGRGARFVTFLGGHDFFHSPNDTVDVAVDPASVARWSRAAWEIVRHALEEPGE
jgi:hypothetical protein